ncbi:MAG: YgiT-type zinc finger protein [Hafnia sp.]
MAEVKDEVKDEVCPVCEEGKTLPIIDRRWFEHRGQNALLEVHMSKCDHCNCVMADGPQMQVNALTSMRFKASVDYGKKALHMPDDLLHALYSSRLKPYGTWKHFWAMKLHRMGGLSRLPRGQWSRQFNVGFLAKTGMSTKAGTTQPDNQADSGHMGE